MQWRRAPAKINLTLHVIGRREGGLHEIESLVAFGAPCDWLGYEPGSRLKLDVEGGGAPFVGPTEKNLVLRAARELADRVPGLRLGRFRLIKRLPVAAGLGGGSADAAAALRALAGENGLTVDDERMRDAALAAGADVPVCLSPRSRWMAGVGERLGSHAPLPEIFAVLVNPRAAVPTRQVFEALGLAPGASTAKSEPHANSPLTLASLASFRNDLEAPAARVAPIVATVLETLSRLPHAKVTRMSGSGATCFALFDKKQDAAIAATMIATERPEWWTRPTRLR